MNPRNLDELFWNASIDEMMQGWIYDDKNEHYQCLICGEIKEQGIIYRHDETLFDAKTSIYRHVAEDHGTMFHYLLNMSKQANSLTDTQKQLLNDLFQGFTDREIARNKGGSPSTIRNQRFTLREKEKQSKVFLSLMRLLEQQQQSPPSEKLVDIHPHATMVDDRYVMTEEENRKIIEAYFPDGHKGPLNDFPVKKEKKKVAILRNLMQHFQPNRHYTEKEVNEILRSLYHDYVLLRRYLIQYGFMDRKKDGSAYWVK